MWCPTHKTLYGETKYFIFDATNQIVSTDSPPSLRRFIILVSIIYGCEASVPIVPNINSCHVRIINFQSEPQKIYLKVSGVDAFKFFFFFGEKLELFALFYEEKHLKYGGEFLETFWLKVI